MALGAKPRSVLALVLRQNLQPVIAGTAIGIAGSLAFGRLLTGFLYGVTPGDIPAMLTTIAILSATSILAAWAPARRASRVDSAITLRHE
jgi:ABC-type antimicrobial peptide transport system permease subunit